MSVTVLLLVALALFFDFVNGFHDSANSIATVVSTRVLSPRAAVIWAAFFNFVAFLVFPLHIANTIGKGIIDPSIVDTPHHRRDLGRRLALGPAHLVLGPAHQLLPRPHRRVRRRGPGQGGDVRPGLERHHPDRGLHGPGADPGPGPGLGPGRGRGLDLPAGESHARGLPVPQRPIALRGALYSLGHGGNDAQKTMGIIAILLFSAGLLGPTFYIPTWVVLSCQAAMGLGTLFGGWRIVKTMGQKVAKLRPVDGFCAETGGALTLYLASALGAPVSTTHTITGAIMGVGSLKRLSAVRWGVGGDIVAAWLLTIPAAALISSLCYWLLRAAR